MTLRCFCIGAASAVAIAAFSVALQAAPLSGAGNELKAFGANDSSIEKAAYRRCWWRHGNRVCRWVGYRDYDYDNYGYYGYGPSYGYGSGIGFRFGGGGGHFRGGHRR
jgi:hypothetical protein